MPGNGLVKGIVLRERTIFRVKTQSVDDDACAPFPSWRRCFWRIWTSGVVLMRVVLVLQGLKLYSGTFLFSFLSSFFEAVCIRQGLGLYVVAEAECNWHHFLNLYL